MGSKPEIYGVKRVSTEVSEPVSHKRIVIVCDGRTTNSISSTTCPSFAIALRQNVGRGHQPGMIRHQQHGLLSFR